MNKYFYSLFFVAALGFMPGLKKAETPKAENTTFTYGEKITYKVRYNLYFNVNVGEMAFTIQDKPQVVGGSECYHVVATGKTYGFYDPFFKVRDRFESFIETKTLLPMVFIRDVQEGDYKTSEHVLFNQAKNIAKSRKRTQAIPDETHDIISVVYHARTLDYTNAKKGDKFFMHTFIDDSAYKVGVQYVGKETIKTDKGKFRCIKLKPILIVDRMFKSEEDMTLWVTDDDNHIPVRIESGISVGVVRADLADYSGLKNPVQSKL